MFRSVWGVRSRLLVVFLILLLALSPGATQAHLDPGEEATTIIAYAEINRLDLVTDMDDGFDGDAELLLLVQVQHAGHGGSRLEFQRDDYNWDDGRPWLVQPSELWAHVECRPRAPLSVVLHLIDIDSDLQTATIWAVLSGVGSWVATGAKAGPKGAVAGFVVGFGLSMAGVINDNDDLGLNFGLVPENGPVWVKLRGPDGGADVRFYGRTGVTPDEDCALPPASPEYSLRSPSERTQLLFDPLKEGLAAALAIQPEPGNPAGLTEQQVADIRQSYSRLLLGIGRTVAGLEVEDAIGLRGANGAVEQYLTGLELDREDPVQALAAYEAAFLQAATAFADGVEEEGIGLPFHLSLTPEVLATRAGRQPEILAVAHGASGPVELWLEGLPEGAAATVTPGSEEVPFFKIGLDLAGLAPGRYPIKVLAAGGEGTAEQELLLIVNPKPSPEQAGVEVPGETEAGVTTAHLNPARDQAVTDPGAGWRLKLPAGSLSGSEARVSLAPMSGPALAEMAGAAALPPGARALDFGLLLAAEAGPEGAPAERFGRPVSLELGPGALGIAGIQEPAKVGLLHLSGDGLQLIGGRPAEAGVSFTLEQPGRYLLVEMAPSFADLAGHWARADVELMAAKGIIRGVEPGRFDPAGQVTRAQFAALLARAMGLEPVTGSSAFRDVQPDDWFYGEVGAAAAAGLIRGMGDGRFLPHAPVSREQAGVMLARAMTAAGKALPLTPAEAEALLMPFADRHAVSSWAAAELALAVKEGILRGDEAGALAPGAVASRAEAAVMIARFWR
ncbi:MAG: S-layer homology domain-containing protein [Bacillota bacterium]